MLRSQHTSPAQAGEVFSSRATWSPITEAALLAILHPGHLRHQDAVELEALLPRGLGVMGCAPFLVANTPIGAVFHFDEWPAAALGLCEVRPGVFEGWSWGTDRYAACAPAMAEFIRAEALPALAAAGVHRIQVSALAGYAEAHRWIEWLGLQREGVQHGFGSDGSDFVTFAWVKGLHGPLPGATRRES